MSLLNKKILAVIPARGGSKGIHRKNLLAIHGRTLIEYVAECTKQLSWLDAITLSTDDKEIAEHAKSLGLEVPFLRPQELSSDTAESVDVWIHAWLESEQLNHTIFDLSILLEPTSPMRTPEDIRNAVELLLKTDADSVATISRTPGHYTPHKTLQISNQGFIEPYLADGLQHTIRQQIPDYYHRNGVCYVVTRDSLIKSKNLMENNCVPLLIDRPVVNIDDNIDVKFAELLMAPQE